MTIAVQVISTVLLCFTCMNMGLMLGWPSSTILLFKSANTSLQRPMKSMEISMLGSLPAVGSLVGNLIGAFLLDRLGRKYTTIFSSLFFVIAWSLIALSDCVEVILIAVFLGGAGCATFLQVSIYISEISQDSIRGAMTACPNQFYCLGFLVSYLLGGVLGYDAMVYACLSIAVFSVLVIALLKESPVTLMAKERYNDAAKSIAFYRNTKISSMEVVNELNNIRRSLNSESDDAQTLTCQDVLIVQEFKAKKTSAWQFFKSSLSTRREFYLVLILKIAYSCQGLPVVQVYAEPMFAAAIGDLISPNLCSVILGIVILISGCVSAYLTDVIGRRPLMIYSSISTGLCCFAIGIQLKTEILPKWTIPVFICVFASLHTAGAGTVCFVIISEVFLPEVKSILGVLAVEWSWICLFLTFGLFNLIIESVGLSPVFFFFSLTCLGTATYFYFFMPETKGLPVHAIQKLFAKKMNKSIN